MAALVTAAGLLMLFASEPAVGCALVALGALLFIRERR
jgi:hypothetical protein